MEKLFSGGFKHKKKKVEEDLKHISEEIITETGRITLLKYRLQKFIIEHQYTVNKRDNVDTTFAFQLHNTVSRPRLGLEQYQLEQNRLQNKFDYFRNQYLNQLPVSDEDDINIFFPDMKRGKVDHLALIRKEVTQNLARHHFNVEAKQAEIFETFQKKKQKLEWVIQQLKSDTKTNKIDRNRKINTAHDQIDKLEKETLNELNSIGSYFPDLSQIPYQTLDGEQRIELKQNPVDSTNNVIKRRMVSLLMRKNRFKTKIDNWDKKEVKLQKYFQDNLKMDANINPTDMLYKSANDMIKYNYSLQYSQNEIDKIRGQIIEHQNLLDTLIKSKEVLLEELHLLENVESFHNTNHLIDFMSLVQDNDLENMDDNDLGALGNNIDDNLENGIDSLGDNDDLIDKMIDNLSPEELVQNMDELDVNPVIGDSEFAQNVIQHPTANLGDNTNVNMNINIGENNVKNNVGNNMKNNVENNMENNGTVDGIEDEENQQWRDNIQATIEKVLPIEEAGIETHIMDQISLEDIPLSTKMELDNLMAKIDKIDTI